MQLRCVYKLQVRWVYVLCTHVPSNYILSTSPATHSLHVTTPYMPLKAVFQNTPLIRDIFGNVKSSNYDEWAVSHYRSVALCRFDCTVKGQMLQAMSQILIARAGIALPWKLGLPVTMAKLFLVKSNWILWVLVLLLQHEGRNLLSPNLRLNLPISFLSCY